MWNVARAAGVWIVLLLLAWPGQARGQDAVTGERVVCRDGQAAGFPCNRVDLLAFLPILEIGGRRDEVHFTRLNDLWGWTDPETGNEYALVGRTDGTAFVDVSRPEQPVYLGQLPLHAGARPSAWRDIKVYANHAFIVADAAGPHGLQVFDLTRLRDVQAPPVTFTETAHYDAIGSAHNVVVNEETGYAYAVGVGSGVETCGGGLHMIDVRQPARPAFAGCFADARTGRRSTGYTHDAQCVVYRGPDARYQGREVCFGSNETALSIADVTDKEAPVALSIGTYPTSAYIHQGWLTENHRYFFQDDELDEGTPFAPLTRTIIWDVSNLEDPVVLAEHFGSTAARDHNQYIVGDRVYQSNYEAGLRILDIGDVARPIEIGYFDVYPAGNETNFLGSWSNYPFFDSGIVVLTGIDNGFFVLAPTLPPASTEVGAFTATADGTGAVLAWQTTREVNNAGFEVERKEAGGTYRRVAFVEGAGTTAEPRSYTYRLTDLPPGRHTFRLKQIDAGGAIRFTSEVDVFIVPGTHVLSALYPNPFRSRAELLLILDEAQNVRVELFDALGQQRALLHAGPLSDGAEHRFVVDGTDLAAGWYLVRITGERFSTARKGVKL